MPKERSDDDNSISFTGLTSPTVKMSGPIEDRLAETVPYNFDEPKTRIYRGPGEPDSTADIPAEDPMKDPPVACLLLIHGPGRGALLKLGYGRNSIGRDATERVRLNFGDDQVSRSGHAILTYDPRSQKFYAQCGTGTNLLYIEGCNDPVLTPVVLHGGEVLLIGQTRLKFVPFCGPDFDWHSG